MTTTEPEILPRLTSLDRIASRDSSMPPTGRHPEKSTPMALHPYSLGIHVSMHSEMRKLPAIPAVLPTDWLYKVHGRANVRKSAMDWNLKYRICRPGRHKLSRWPLLRTQIQVRHQGLGTVAVAAHEKLAIPLGLDLAANKTVLLSDASNRSLAAATIKPF
jgi:hypothetical protein